jgi:hypothetical protein
MKANFALIILIFLFSCSEHPNSELNVSNDENFAEQEEVDSLSLKVKENHKSKVDYPSRGFNFNQYIENNYSEFEDNYDLENDFATTFNLRTNQLEIFDSDLIVSNEIELKFQEDKFLSPNPIKHNFYKVQNGYVFLSYFELVKSEYDDFIAYSWIKSFDLKGLPIDTICIGEYSNNEGVRIRMFSKIDSLSAIKISYLESNHEEDLKGLAINKIKNLQIDYTIENGKFICNQDDNNPIFKDQYRYSILNDVIVKNLGNCYNVQKINYGDANNDGLTDVIVELKSLKQNCNWVLFDYDILFCFSNSKKEMVFVRPPMNLDLNNNEFRLDRLVVKEGSVSFDLIYIKDKRRFSFYYKYDELSKNWLLIKVLNNFNNEWFYPNKKIVLQGSSKVAMQLIHQ